MAQTVCLDEDKHAGAILRKLQKMKQDVNLCDFKIKVNDKEFNAHKNILAAGSNYFEAMFNHDTEETRNGVVVMRQVDEECVKSCIDFIYSGKFDIPRNKIGCLLHVVIMLHLDEMKVAICGILEQTLNVENFFSTRSIADMYRLGHISKLCNEFYNENFLPLSLQPGFQDEDLLHIYDVIKTNKFQLLEEEKVSVCLRWAGYNEESKKHLYDMLGLINLWTVPQEFLQNLLVNDPCVHQDLDLFRILSGPLTKSSPPRHWPVQKEEKKVEKMKKKKIEKCKESIILFDANADSLQSYDPLSGSVTKFHNEKFVHLKKFSASIFESYVYVLCANKAVFRLNFQYKHSKWEKMPETLLDHGQTPSQIAFGGALFVIGGFDIQYNAMTAVEKFDPEINRWVCMNDKPDPIAIPTLVVSGSFIYSIGGFTETGKDSKIFSRYADGPDHWVNLPSMIGARSFSGVVAVSLKIYVMGGMRNSSKLKTIESYDVMTSEWTVLSPMLKRHENLKAHFADGHIYAVGNGCSEEMEVYDIERDEWCKAPIKGRFQIHSSVLMSSM